MTAAEKHLAPGPLQPKRPWISAHTLALLEGRGRLIRHGSWAALPDQNKIIKSSARKDRVSWVERTVGTEPWAPVRALSRPRQPRAVKLDPPNDDDRLSPVEVAVKALRSKTAQ
eukprot:14988741-Alexandrium_andersonii.AAC.1